MAVATIERRPLGALSRAGIVVAMHAAALFVFARAFGLVPGVADIPPEIELARVPDEIKIADKVPKPEYKPEYDTIAQVPKPEILLEFDLGETAITAELREPEKIDIDKGSAEVKPALVGVMRDPRNPPTQPPYPAEMIRLGKEGVVEVEILVNPDGRVAEARILKSSGFSAFDRVTVDEARRKWRFKPATRDGEPYAQWTRQRVVFELRNQ
jgi:TonB family protein